MEIISGLKYRFEERLSTGSFVCHQCWRRMEIRTFIIRCSVAVLLELMRLRCSFRRSVWKHIWKCIQCIVYGLMGPRKRLNASHGNVQKICTNAYYRSANCELWIETWFNYDILCDSKTAHENIIFSSHSLAAIANNVVIKLMILRLWAKYNCIRIESNETAFQRVY